MSFYKLLFFATEKKPGYIFVVDSNTSFFDPNSVVESVVSQSVMVDRLFVVTDAYRDDLEAGSVFQIKTDFVDIFASPDSSFVIRKNVDEQDVFHRMQVIRISNNLSLSSQDTVLQQINIGSFPEFLVGQESLVNGMRVNLSGFRLLEEGHEHVGGNAALNQVFK